MSKLKRVPGVRVKFRTEERNGHMFATAAIWNGDERLAEIASLDLELIERPGDPNYQAWVDAISAAFAGYLNRKTGQTAITTKRQAPRYQGE